MTLISEAYPGRKDGSYTLVFGDEDIGSLMSAIQATTIKMGNELERIIISSAHIIDENLIDAFFSKTLAPGIYIIPKSMMSDKRLNFDQRPDVLVVDVNRNTCKVIEIKLGDNFDTKKSQGEVDNLRSYTEKLNRATTYKVSFAVCMWYAINKDAVVKGFKSKITDKEALTGSEFCAMVHLDYNDINIQMSIHRQMNRDFLFEKISLIASKYNHLEE